MKTVCATMTVSPGCYTGR